MTLFAGFVIGAFIAYTVVMIFMGVFLKEQATRIRSLQLTIFGLEQTLIHEREGNTRPLYEMATDGVDPVVRRRTPLAEQEPLRTSSKASEGTIDLTWADDE